MFDLDVDQEAFDSLRQVVRDFASDLIAEAENGFVDLEGPVAPELYVITAFISVAAEIMKKTDTTTREDVIRLIDKHLDLERSADEVGDLN